MNNRQKPILTTQAHREIQERIDNLPPGKTVTLKKLMNSKRWARSTAGQKRKAGREFQDLVARDAFAVEDAGYTPSHSRLYRKTKPIIG